MNAILLAVIFTVAVLADFFWEPLAGRFKNPNHGKYLKVAVGVILILLGWGQAVLQYRDEKESAKDTEFLKHQLTSAVHIGTNSSATINAMQGELTRLQSKSDEDSIAQLDAILSATTADKVAVSFTVGSLAMRIGRDVDAETYFRRCIADNPNHCLARNNLGLILQRRGDVAAAKEQFRRSLETDAENLPTAVNYAKILNSEGDAQGAMIVIGNASKHIDRVDAETLLPLAQVALLVGRPTNGIILLDRYMKLASHPHQEAMTIILSNYWASFSPDQKASFTNWSGLFVSKDRVLFEASLNALNSSRAPATTRKE
jgi:Tfp pilus assembly protein PilF